MPSDSEVLPGFVFTMGDIEMAPPILVSGVGSRGVPSRESYFDLV